MSGRVLFALISGCSYHTLTQLTYQTQLPHQLPTSRMQNDIQLFTPHWFGGRFSVMGYER